MLLDYSLKVTDKFVGAWVRICYHVTSILLRRKQLKQVRRSLYREDDVSIFSRKLNKRGRI